MLEQPLVDASGFETGHLGGAHIKGPGPPSERAGAPSGLIVTFQKHHLPPGVSEQGGGGEPGDPPSDHHHIDGLCGLSRLNRVVLHRSMLAAEAAAALAVA